MHPFEQTLAHLNTFTHESHISAFEHPHARIFEHIHERNRTYYCARIRAYIRECKRIPICTTNSNTARTFENINVRIQTFVRAFEHIFAQIRIRARIRTPTIGGHSNTKPPMNSNTPEFELPFARLFEHTSARIRTPIRALIRTHTRMNSNIHPRAY